MYVNNLPKAATESAAAGSRARDMLIASPVPYHYATSHISLWMTLFFGLSRVLNFESKA